MRTDDGRYIQFGANQRLGDERAWMGQPFDLKYFDECVQFLEIQIRLHLGWIRSATPGQRCRAVLGTNPPIDSTGDYIIGMFRPWLDLTHPNPAENGELRWYFTDNDGKDYEVDEDELGTDEHGRRVVQRDGEVFHVMSRTFIRSRVTDNPYYAKTEYQARLDSLPEPIRSAVRDGNFMAARADAEWQVIPTQWIIEAQDRWEPEGWKQFQMTAMALDPAGGGKDSEELIWRHGPWFSECISAQGEKTAVATGAAANIFMHRTDACPVIVDAGGGYAGPIVQRLDDNKIPYVRFKPSATGVGKAVDLNMPFANKRAEAWWRFREALDPARPGGSEIALPPDPELRSDLAAPCLDTRAMEERGVIQLESKDKIRERIGRSPGKGDAAVMCWASGQSVVKRGVRGYSSTNRQTHAKVGHSKRKAKRRRT